MHTVSVLDHIQIAEIISLPRALFLSDTAVGTRRSTSQLIKLWTCVGYEYQSAAIFVARIANAWRYAKRLLSTNIVLASSHRFYYPTPRSTTFWRVARGSNRGSGDIITKSS